MRKAGGQTCMNYAGMVKNNGVTILSRISHDHFIETKWKI